MNYVACNDPSYGMITDLLKILMLANEIQGSRSPYGNKSRKKYVNKHKRKKPTKKTKRRKYNKVYIIS